MTHIRLYHNGAEKKNPALYSYSDLLNDFFGKSAVPYRSQVPPANIREEKDAYVIDLAVPGVKKADISIQVENDILSISHNLQDEKVENNYSKREFDLTGFEKSFELPDTVNTDKIQASMESGILTVRIPKKDDSIERGPRDIRIS